MTFKIAANYIRWMINDLLHLVISINRLMNVINHILEWPLTIQIVVDFAVKFVYENIIFCIC
jgi:hypothetical protein